MNVVRHAAAASCRVRITLVENELQVDVTDDGTGIAAEGAASARAPCANGPPRLVATWSSNWPERAGRS